MTSLATGVGDLKRALTNVKVRGVWGEYQLHNILEQMLTPDQYVGNFKPDPEAGGFVEYAVRLPGHIDGEEVYLPIDAKFPQDGYQSIVDAAERADPNELRKATDALVRTVRGCAKDICDKYLNPPRTTDFAILFFPTEGLYAEVLRQPGLVQELQRTCHVVLAGPTTLSAILNSLNMGFRTLAIEKRSSEVWKTLGAVKTEFGKFAEVLDRIKRQLAATANAIEQTGVRTRVMERKLREVEGLSAEAAGELLNIEVEAKLLSEPDLEGEAGVST
jgi:DNA recombination protein RmuC